MVPAPKSGVRPRESPLLKLSTVLGQTVKSLHALAFGLSSNAPRWRHDQSGREPVPTRLVVLHLFRMRFGMSELRKRALAAGDEVAAQARVAPVERHLALRFALAFLSNFADERWPFDNFWRAVALRDEKVRSATVTAARNAIHRSVKE